MPLWIALSLAIVLGVTIATILFTAMRGGKQTPPFGWVQEDSEPSLIIDTRTPTPSPSPTSTRPRVIAPTLVATATATASSTPIPATTATATAFSTPIPATTATVTAFSTPTSTPTATLAPTHTPAAPTPIATPHVVVIGDPARLRAGPGLMYDVAGYAQRGDALPLIARTANGEWLQVNAGGRFAWMLASLAQAQAGAEPIPVASEIPPTPTATVTPTPTPLPAPVLIEPPSGARFADKVRFKFSWSRRLRHDERVSIYVRSANGVDEFDWWVSEADILVGGGAIRAQGDGFVYEVNSGIGSLPPGEAFWRVAVFVDTPTDKRQVSPGSAERQIFRK